MKIAIIGSGISGLSAAWTLGEQHEVTLFEKHATPGMGALNVALELDGVQQVVDVPIRAFNASYYPTLMGLYREAGVEVTPAAHSAAYVDRDFNPIFSYQYLNLFDRALPLPDFKASVQSLGFISEFSKLMLRAKWDLMRGACQGLTLSEYLVNKGYSDRLVNEVLIPSFSSICTCQNDSTRGYPAEIILDFLVTKNLLFNGIWRAKYGSNDVIEKLLARCQHVITEVDIAGVGEQNNRAKVTLADGSEQMFDHVVIATQANQAASLLHDQSSDLAQILAQLLIQIPYESGELIIHRDSRLLPKVKQQWQPVNFVVDPTVDAPMASIWLNRLYPKLEGLTDVFQTLNPILEPDGTLVDARASFERPIVTLESLEVVRQLTRLQAQSRGPIWVCGSYAYEGIPLLEGGAVTARAVADRIATLCD